MTTAVGLAAQIALRVSPIILTGGIATSVGGSLPIVALLGGANLLTALTGSSDLTADNFFAQFRTLPGGTLIANQYGQYPFANQQVAANALIVQPNRVSVFMACPAREESGGFVGKLALMTLLQTTLSQHTLSGGTFSVVTPAYIYTNLLLEALRFTGDTGTQQQTEWQWDFWSPLLTNGAAQNVLNSITQAISQGSPTSATGAAVAMPNVQ